MARHSSLGDFGKHLKGRAAKLDSEVSRALKETAMNVVTNVSTDTPIDTGQAQSNWLTKLNARFPYFIWNEDFNRAAQDSIDFAQQALRVLKSTDKIHITNRLPYIIQLNRGSSKQAPALFVQAAVLRASYGLKTFKINWT